MKSIHVALFLAIVLAVSSSSSGGMAAKLGPDYFQDTCSSVISPGPTCDRGKCSADCARQFSGGVGDCVPEGCRCVYTCAAPPPAS